MAPLRTEATRLLDALNLARSEAVMHNNPVVLCPRPAPGEDDASCDSLFANGFGWCSAIALAMAASTLAATN